MTADSTRLRMRDMSIVDSIRSSVPDGVECVVKAISRWARLSVLASVACLMATGLSVAAEESADAEQIGQLITRLGAVEFADREQAERDLVATGLVAIDALREQAESRDAEVRRRVRRVLRGILEADLEQRIVAFAADATLEGEGLPGWARFRDQTGSSPAERSLFVKMLRAEPGLLLSSEVGPESAVDALRFRVQRFMQAQNTPNPSRRTLPPVASTLAFLFISSDTELLGQTAPQEVSWIRNWLRQGPFRTFVDDKENGTAARKLLAHWVLARTSNGSYHIDRLYDALTFKLKEALPIAVQGLKTKPYMGMSIEAIGRLGGKEYAALLLPLLDDKTVIASYRSNNKTIEILASDVALAWLANLTGQSPKTYGLPHAEAWFTSLKKNNSSGFNSGSYRVEDVEKRAEYRKAWDAWLAKNSLPKPPKDFADVAALGPAVVVKKVVEPEEEEDWEEPEPYNGPQLADRFDLQKLKFARQAIEDRKWFDAARLLAELAEMPTEKWFQPERGVPNFRELRSEVERLILAMPEPGLAAVEQLSGVVARDQLDTALAQSDMRSVKSVAQGYFFTQAGAEATWRLATVALDAGQPFDALLQFERLVVASRFSAAFEPQLSLRRALCHARLQQFEQAEAVLRDLHERFPEVPISPGNSDAPLFSEPNESLAWLTAVTGQTDLGEVSWLMHRGNALRNSTAGPVIPNPDAAPLATLAETKLLLEAVKYVSRQKTAQRLGRIPSVQPIVVGDRVIFRTATGLQAVGKDGKPLWSAPQQDVLWEMTRAGQEWKLPKEPPAKPVQKTTSSRTPTTPAKAEDQIGNDVVDGLRQRLLENTLYGTLSSDGDRVFAIETDDFRCPPYVQRLMVAPDGHLELDTRSMRKGNSLVAYDVRTGRLLWEQSRGDSPADPSEATAASPIQFLGVPLVAGSSLFAVVRVNDEVRLRQLDPETGESSREWLLQNDAPPPKYAFWARQYPQAPSQRHACSPSFVDGTIVCLTPSNRVVAIDLRTGRLQWSWMGRSRPKTLAQFRFNPWQQFAANAQRDSELDHWCDVSLVLADGSVLVATPDSNNLTCLDQKDGNVRWSVQRRDGLYVAGVHDGRAVVIGRGGARAFNLEDGSLAWPAGEVTWPEAAMPSGSGYLSGDRYCVPLTTGEVILINLKTGQWVARSHSREQAVPGNLVALDEIVWSLGLDGLRRFTSVEERSAELAELAASQPDNGKALNDLGESLLNSGRVSEALTALRRATQTDQKERAEELMARAVRDGVPFDLKDRSRLVNELELSNGTLQQRVSLHAETALGFERQGDLVEALRSLMKIADASITRNDLSGDKPLTREESVSRSARIDRWFQGNFRDWYIGIDGTERTRIDERVADLVKADPANAILWFGKHPIADTLRVQVADKLDDDDRLRWEVLLRLASADKTESASASAFSSLEQGLESVAPLRGAHVRQHKDAVNTVVRLDDSPWPDGSVQKKVEKRDPKVPYVQHIQFPIERYDRRLDEPMWLQFNTSNRTWSVLDASGRLRHTLEPPEGGNTASYSYSTNVTQAYLVGPVLVVWSGMEAAAFHLEGDKGKRLWARKVYDPQNRPWIMRYVPRRIQRAGRRAAVVFGVQGPAAWRAIVANPDFVALQIDQQLLALDLTTGQVLWKRDGLPYDCDVTGNRDVVAVIPPAEDEAIVFSGLDGRELSRHRLPDGDWVTMHNGLLVTWRSRPQQSTMQCFDMHSGEERWSLPFAAGTKYHRSRQDQLAVLEPAGAFSVINAETGKATATAQLDPVKDLQGVTMFESRGRYIVCAQTPKEAPAKGVMVRVNMSGNSPARLRVGGRVSAVDAISGKVDWTAELAEQAVAPPVMSDVPLLACYHTVQKQVKRDNGAVSTTHEYWLQVLNLNNGLVAHNEKITSGNQIDQQFELKEARVDLHTRTNVLQFRFAVTE